MKNSVNRMPADCNTAGNKKALTTEEYVERKEAESKGLFANFTHFADTFRGAIIQGFSETNEERLELKTDKGTLVIEAIGCDECSCRLVKSKQ